MREWSLTLIATHYGDIDIFFGVVEVFMRAQPLWTHYFIKTLKYFLPLHQRATLLSLFFDFVAFVAFVAFFHFCRFRRFLSSFNRVFSGTFMPAILKLDLALEFGYFRLFRILDSQKKHCASRALSYFFLISINVVTLLLQQFLSPIHTIFRFFFHHLKNWDSTFLKIQLFPTSKWNCNGVASSLATDLKNTSYSKSLIWTAIPPRKCRSRAQAPLSCTWTGLRESFLATSSENSWFLK